MTRCYVFLDVDGVLNSSKWFHHVYQEKGNAARHPHDHLDPTAIKRFNRIIQETGAVIVISSTWRMGRTVEELQELLGMHRLKGQIVGKTPHFGFAGGVRGEEILDWLKQVNEQDAVFIAIDDDAYDMDPVKDKLVQTDNQVGIQDYDVEKAIKMIEDQLTRKKLEKGFGKISDGEWHGAKFMANDIQQQTDWEIFNEILETPDKTE